MNKARSWITKHFDLVRLVVAVLIGILLAVVVILCISEEPGTAISKLLGGPLQSKRRFGNVIELMIPLTFAGLSITVMFTANQFNMGTEGAFYAGGAVAAAVALSVGLPAGISPLVCIAAGGLVGGVICAIAGFLKMKWNTSELVASLMLNYIAYYLFKYLLFTDRFKDAGAGFVATYPLPESSCLSQIVEGTRIHTGLLVMLVTVVVIAVYMKRSAAGFALKLTGENQAFARYSGVGVGGVILASQFIGGLLGGMGGAVQVLGMYDRFQWTSLPGYGFDGVIVAILARKNPVMVPVAAFFLAYLRIGSDVMSSSTDVTNELVSIIQSIIILFVSAKVFLEAYRQKLVVKEATIHE